MINDIIKKILREATSEMGSRGSYITPLQPGMRDFNKNKLAPFTDSVSDYKSPLVDYDSYDHKFDLRKNQIRELEKTARKITNYIKKHPYSTFSDDEGNIINPTPSGKIKKDPYNLEIVPIKRKINEADTSISAGQYNGPIEIGLKKWKKEELGPFTEFVDIEVNHKKKQKTLKNNIKRVVGKWEKSKDGSYDIDTYDVHTINEDLAVWFGKKKKPKGSKQPKGPWVNICRKIDGKHPPCGRPDTSKGGYPKCRAAGVAGKMSDSEKRSACQQKRNAEKKDIQTGKGQKPIMTSHKKRTNENMKTIITLTETDIKNIVQRVLNENILNEDLSKIPDNLKTSPINLKCFAIPTEVNPRGSSKEYSDYLITDYNDAGGIERFFFSKQSENLDMSFGSANEKSDIQLDVVPIESDRLRTIFKLDNSEQFLLKHTYANTSYYCSVKQESNAWKTYFDNLGVATDINV